MGLDLFLVEDDVVVLDTNFEVSIILDFDVDFVIFVVLAL